MQLVSALALHNANVVMRPKAAAALDVCEFIKQLRTYMLPEGIVWLPCSYII